MNITLSPRPVDLAAIAPGTASGTGGDSFAAAIGAAIADVERSSLQAHAAATALLTGGGGDLPAVALAAQRAELSLEMFQQVRNKFVSAYQEIMKMPM